MKLSKLISCAILSFSLLSCANSKPKEQQENNEINKTIYNINFNTNGGSLIEPIEIEKDSKIPKPNEPIKVGYKFEHWTFNDSIWDFENVVNSDMELNAKYSIDAQELPIIKIDTEEQKPIVDKVNYVPSLVSIFNTDEEYTLTDVEAGIRGRGNTTWNYEKKPYRIKFNKKQSLFGSSYKAKSWVLLANHSDKSLMRNYVAFELGKFFDDISYSSFHMPVELYLNDSYEGVYLLCDQIQTGEGRVDIDDSFDEDGTSGFLVERDFRAEGTEGIDYFKIGDQRYSIKSPDTESEEYLNNHENIVGYIKGYFENVFSVLNNDSATWESITSLVDVNSFADSYIIDELFLNRDCGSTSCFMYKDKSGKLTKGPLWDYDTTAGNINYDVGNRDSCPPNSELYANGAFVLYSLLLARSEFVDIVKAKLTKYSSGLNDVFKVINVNDSNCVYLKNKTSFDRNFDRWDIMGQPVSPEPKDIVNLISVKDQTEFLYNWLTARYSFIQQSYFGSI